jgi:hypothetical protein
MATFLRVWTLPFLLAAIGFAGLICALVGDGWWDAASWAALSALVALIVWCSRRGS